MLAAIRIAIGLIFLVSGFEKAVAPYQNFLYIIQAYQALPAWQEVWVARLFPWFELLLGLFLTLGLWVPRALLYALMTFAIFIIVVGQALLRGLPLDQCGCFGELLHVPPQAIIVFDSALLLLTLFLLRYPQRAQLWSLDRHLEK